MGGNYNKIRKEESSTELKSSSKRKDWKPKGWGQVGLCGCVSKVEEVPCARNEIVQLELVPVAANLKRASELDVTWSDGCLQHPL